MQYRCHDCGELFESPHTSYKHAKGFHPKDNPTHDSEVAAEQDHCQNCQNRRTYDPVAARTADLANATMGPSSSVITDLMAQVETLKAQVEAKKAQDITVAALHEQVKTLAAQLAPAAPPAAPAGS